MINLLLNQGNRYSKETNNIDVTSTRKMAARNAPTVFIETHGCKLNQADTQELARRFVKSGYRVTHEREGADVYIVNTCTVTHVADGKARQALRAARRRQPSALVVATGCYAQRNSKGLLQMPEVDLVVGNKGKDTLVESITTTMPKVKLVPKVYDQTLININSGHKARAMLKIQEGCDQVCAYCIVPKVRGRERSVPPEILVKQIETLVREGHREVVLTGTQLGSYGFDIPGASLTALLTRILEETDLPRLRVSSIQPQELNENLLSLWNNSRLCPHFHIPLQSGSEKILQQMRRKYTPQRYKQSVAKVRDLVPNAAITTDVIIGFPGETDDLFEESRLLCEETSFANLHVFPYSSRPGTSAAYFAGAISNEAKRVRMKVMLDLARKQAQQYRYSILGTTRPVLWEKMVEENGSQIWSGLTDSYIRVATKNDLPLRNQITPILLEHVEGEIVWGSTISN